MIIKKAEYKKTMKEVNQRISDDIYCCDQCKKIIKEKDDKLEITVFFHNKKLKKQDEDNNTDKYEFCSWKCVCLFLPKVNTDYFVSLPFLHYDKTTKGTMGKDFIKLLAVSV